MYFAPTNSHTFSTEILIFRGLIASPAKDEPRYLAPARSINNWAARAEAISVKAGSVFLSILLDASLDNL
ncbi:unannotated protein [freshwater metagenome]|uniref:Unannotated protein n=1 Tax=freshwater metagenome TaxID=449393 RepID=A0A6J6VLS8_9ZZZZ